MAAGEAAAGAAVGLAGVAGVREGFVAGAGEDVGAGLAVAGLSGLCVGRGVGAGVPAGGVDVHVDRRAVETASNAASSGSGVYFNT